MDLKRDFDETIIILGYFLVVWFLMLAALFTYLL